MGRNIHSSYYEDNYIRYQCQQCKRSFIVGETLSEGMELTCPYCQSPEIETVAAAMEDNTEDMEMGCLGIYYSLYDDGSLMLYTEHEFSAALAFPTEKYDGEGVHLNSVMDCITRYCSRRDGRDTD